MTCPVKGEAGCVEEVQIVTAESVLAIFACVTALDASLAVVIEPSAGVSEMSFPSLAAVTDPAPIFAVVTALSAS